MYQILRIWSLSLVMLLVGYLSLAVVLSLLATLLLPRPAGSSGWLEGVGELVSFGFILFGMLLGALKVSDAQYEGASSQDVSDAVSSAGTTGALYFVGLLAVAVVVYLTATRLQRTALNAQVIDRLTRADERYLTQVLAISHLEQEDLAGLGRDFVDDVLAREATGHRGDIASTARAAADQEAAVAAQERRRAAYLRRRTLITEEFEPTSRVRTVLAGVEAAAYVVLGWLLVLTWTAANGSLFWSLPALAVIGFLGYDLALRGGRGRRVLYRFAHPRRCVAALVGVVAVAVPAFAVFTWALTAIGNEPASDVLPVTGYFVAVAVLAVVGLPILNLGVYRRRGFGEADLALADLFRTLRDEGVTGSHDFVQCASCDTVGVLRLGRSEPCPGCARPLDRSMSVGVSVDV